MRLSCTAGLVVVFVVNLAAQSPALPPSERVIEKIEIHGASRLAALAYVGFKSGTPLLVEAGDMQALQTPVQVSLHQVTVRSAVQQILEGQRDVVIRDAASLLIVSVASPEDRLLTQSLGQFSLPVGNYVQLEAALTTSIRSAMGCPLMGTAWVGGVPPVVLPRIELQDATFERIVEAAATPTTPTIWIVQTKARLPGCIDNPGASWQFGVYGFGDREYAGGTNTCQNPLIAYSGPEFLLFDPKSHAFPEPCSQAVYPLHPFPPGL